jgi:hypothetical protein
MDKFRTKEGVVKSIFESIRRFLFGIKTDNCGWEQATRYGPSDDIILEKVHWDSARSVSIYMGINGDVNIIPLIDRASFTTPIIAESDYGNTTGVRYWFGHPRLSPRVPHRAVQRISIDIKKWEES